MNSELRPILSICIGTYNRKEILSELIQLILTYPGDEIEVVVCDNASTDGTWEMLSQIVDSRFHCYQNEKNYGAEYNWVKSRLLGTGKYIMNLNDRALLDMGEVQSFVNEMKNIDADAVVASGHMQSEKMNTRSYEDRVCIVNKLGEPGDIIYSGKIIREYKKKYVSEVLIENFIIHLARLMNLFYQSNNWYWYSGRIVMAMTEEVLKNIKVERKSNGYIFTGCPKGQIGACIDIMMYVLYIEEQYKKDYCRGIIKAYARTLFWTVWRSNQCEAICQRYNYFPPKHTFWLKEMWIWRSKVKRCLRVQNCFNKEMSKFLYQTLWKEYFEFLHFRICISKVVKALVKMKHKIEGARLDE